MIEEIFVGLAVAVAEVFKSVVTVVDTVIGVGAKCGSYISEKAAEIIREIDPNSGGICETLEEASVFLNDLGDLLLGICKDFEIIELKDCSCEELGAKTLIPETRSRGEGETAASYIEYLNSVELDKEEFENWNPEKKVASSVIGNALVSESIKEKTGVEIPVDFAANMEKAEVKHEEAAAIIEAFGNEGKESMSEMNDFLTNAPNMTEEKAEKVESIVTEALKELNPETSEKDVSDKITAMKVAAQSE